MPIGDPESSRSMNWMETGNDRTNGTDGICVESCPASCDGVERHGRIAVGGTTNERRPNWSPIHSGTHWNERHCLNTTSSCFEWIIPAPSQLAGQLSTQIPSVPSVRSLPVSVQSIEQLDSGSPTGILLDVAVEVIFEWLFF